MRLGEWWVWPDDPINVAVLTDVAEELDRRGAIVEELLDAIKGQQSEDMMHDQKMQSFQVFPIQSCSCTSCE